MKISELSVRQPVTISMLFALICVVSAIFVPRLGVALFPSVTFPMLSVSTTYGNVGPAEVEQNVTKLLESRLSVVSGLKSMTSTSSAGRSNISLEFGYDTDLTEASDAINQILSRVVRMLPDECDTPILRKFDINSMPIMRLTVRGDLPISELKALAEDKIAPLLERVDGVAATNVSGGANKIIRVDVTENRLRAYGLTLSGIASSLAVRNIQSSGGTMTEDGKNYQIFVDEKFRTLDDIRQTVVAGVSIPAVGSSVTRSNVVRLEDVAEVSDSYDYSGNAVYIDGVPGLYISVTNETDSNSTSVAEAVRDAIPEINALLPFGVELSVLSDNTTMISSTMNEVYNSALQGAVLAMLVILLFLRSMKGTLIIGLSMPISILVTLLGMSLLDLTLNMMTMTGLILGIGMIVDSSIVVLDNIHRYREKGDNSAVAAIKGSGEVVIAITASTLTTLCVFLPVLIYKAELENLGQMFGDMVVTVVLSLTVSLFVSITLVPALSGSILRLNTRVQKPLRNPVVRRIDEAIERLFQRIEDGYARSLSFALRNRLLVLTFVAMLFGLSVIQFLSLGLSFAPQARTDDSVTISLTLPEGTDNSITEAILFQAQEIIVQKVKGYKSLILTVGTGNTGSIQITLPDIKKQTITPEEVRNLVQKDLAGIPGATFLFTAGRSFRPGSAIDVRLSSEDQTAVADTAARVVEILKGIPGLTEVKTDLEGGSPQYTVVVDRDRAAAFGVSVSAISSEIQAALNGIQSTTIQYGNEEVSIRVYLPDYEISSLSDLTRLSVKGTKGMVSLDNLVSFQPTTAPRTISREEGLRVNHVTAALELGTTANRLQPIVEKAIAEKLALPDSVALDYGGEAQDLSKSGGTMLLVILIAVILVFIVMAAQFESLVDPLIILVSIPLLLIGVVAVYTVSGQAFNLFSAVGIVALVGIVVNNGIVLVDYTNGLMKNKIPVGDACIAAARNRLRPILMTTLTTVFATIPMGFFPGEGGEQMQPIGVTIVGGILSGAVLTLFVTPIMYTLLNKRREKRFYDPDSLQNMLENYQS